ncbi:N-acetylmuramoyl-L-alanine amidase family protein [uncultured Eubacterium sp.]|uniref:peptidoglycan recognition protein family protein n=1 Tax=Eubacterium sp. TaxID=142586 RepID=UPI0025F34D95|nr:peptidoglycan recognition family protein [uncultured Eubacterium sp.]
MAAQKKVQKNAPRRKKKRKNRRKRYDMSRVWMALGLLALVLLVIVGVTGHQKNKAVSADSPVTLSEVDENRPELDVELLTVNPYSRPGTALEKVNGIVIHYTANPGATAIANRNYFENLKDTHTTKASSHFVVGLEGEIVQCIPTAEIAYASNDRNSDTISIECCYKNEDGSFEQATYDSVIRLTAWLCEKFGLTSEDVIRHYDVTGKLCPLYYVEHEDAWTQFKKDVDTYLQVYKTGDENG